MKGAQRACCTPFLTPGVVTQLRQEGQRRVAAIVATPENGGSLMPDIGDLIVAMAYLVLSVKYLLDFIG